jgi:hypothetical protein
MALAIYNESMPSCVLYLDENNIFIIQKLLYYFELNKIYTNAFDPQIAENKCEYIVHGIMNVRSKQMLFLIPKYTFSFKYKEEMLVFSYKKCQDSVVDRGTVVRMEQIELSGKSVETLQEFLYEIEKLEFMVSENKLIKYIWKDSYWKYCNGFKRRKLDTLYLPELQKNHVVNEIDKFINLSDIPDDTKESIYNSLCIPERKVFLFWGIPGTGKTTFIRSIASHFNKNIAIVKNTHNIDDASLENMLEELPRNCIILFEDIDSLFQGRSNVANTNITFSGLLNFLDGIIDYDKLLIFITTNSISHIDDALRRRVDVFLEFTYIKKHEVKQMFTKFFGDKFSANDFCYILKGNITANALEKYFIKCITDHISPLDNIDILYSYMALTKNKESGNMYT